MKTIRDIDSVAWSHRRLTEKGLRKDSLFYPNAVYYQRSLHTNYVSPHFSAGSTLCFSATATLCEQNSLVIRPIEMLYP